MSERSISPGTNPIVNHVGQCVADLDRATTFWCEVLGFEVDRPDYTGDEKVVSRLLGVAMPVGLTARYLRCGDYVHELLHFDRPGNPPAQRREFVEPGLTHLSLCVDDVAAAVTATHEHGGEVLFEEHGVAMIRDPDGQLIEVLPMAYRQSLPT